MDANMAVSVPVTMLNTPAISALFCTSKSGGLSHADAMPVVQHAFDLRRRQCHLIGASGRGKIMSTLLKLEPCSRFRTVE